MITWQFIHNKLNTSTAVILLYVLESKGSSPGRQGFHMAVAADGTFEGTIGGGIMEHKFVEMAKARLQQQQEENAVFKQVHDKNSAKNQSGMICSGEQTIFLYNITKADSEPVAALLSSLQANRNGTLKLTATGILFSEEIPPADFFFSQQNDTDFLYIEKTGYKNILHIIGGGHCALALSKLMREMDFYIHLYDDRENLHTMQQNSFAHEQHLLNSYEDLSGLVKGGENVYVVIMTFGYRTDDIALRALLTERFRYIGMLGSKNKIEKMLAAYREEKIDETLLMQVHAPIGIQVKSQTTAEIAISIAAEIIQVKNAGLK
ncbi:MAG: XdhC family protein [Ferruginibacter sp.]